MYASLVIKDGQKFLCWNSFQSKWYWGDRNHSEKFTQFDEPNTLTRQLLDIYPTAKVVFTKDSEGSFEI